MESRTNTAMRIANIITVPACLGLAVLAAPISELLYNTAAAGPAIRVLALATFLIGLQQITNGLLQGMGHTGIPLLNMGISALVKIILSWYLTAIPWLGEVGAAWATNADIALATALNIYFAGKYAAYRHEWFYIGRGSHGRYGCPCLLFFSYDLRQFGGDTHIYQYCRYRICRRVICCPCRASSFFAKTSGCG